VAGIPPLRPPRNAPQSAARRRTSFARVPSRLSGGGYATGGGRAPVAGRPAPHLACSLLPPQALPRPWPRLFRLPTCSFLAHGNRKNRSVRSSLRSRTPRPACSYLASWTRLCGSKPANRYRARFRRNEALRSRVVASFSAELGAGGGGSRNGSPVRGAGLPATTAHSAPVGYLPASCLDHRRTNGQASLPAPGSSLRLATSHGGTYPPDPQTLRPPPTPRRSLRLAKRASGPAGSGLRRKTGRT